MYYNENVQEGYDTRSVVSEPVQLMPMVEQSQPVTFRKYKTTKTTTTTHHVMPQKLNAQMCALNQLNSQNSHQLFDQCANQTMPQAYHREANRYYHNENVSNSSNMRSSSIPRSFQQAQCSDQNFNKSNTQLDQSASSMRYFSSRNAASNNQAAVNRARSDQYHGEQKHAGMAAASSCIDYSNSFYNSDWHMRHGNHIKNQNSIPTELPIYMQRN